MTLQTDIQQCQICQGHIPNSPRPILQFSPSSRVLIIGQAPGQKAHEAGMPFKDVSGKRLREWLGINEKTFYDASKIALMPMAFCYPGKGKTGDLPPPTICQQTWHSKLLQAMPSIELVILLGQYSQNYYLSHPQYFKWLSQRERASCTTLHNEHKTLTERVKWQSELPDSMAILPHPSPRNQLWLKKNPWFEQDVLPQLKRRTHGAISHDI